MTAFLCALAGNANAQNPVHPDFEVPPMTYKGFLIAPAIEIEQKYDDNILGSETNENGDFITSVRPELAIKKEFGRHQASLNLKGIIKRYWENPDEDVEDGSVVFKTDLEAYRGLLIPLEISYSIDHLDKANRSSASLTEKPQEQSHLIFKGGVVINPNRLGVEIIGTHDQFRAEDVRNKFTGIVTPGEDRDTDTTKLSVTSWYETKGWVSPQVAIIYEDVDDIKPTFIGGGFNGEERDNNAIRVLAGARLNYKDLILGSFGVGYEERTYDSNNIDAISAISFRGDLQLKPTRRDTITFEGSRSTNDDNEIKAGATTTALGLNYTREINSRVFLDGSAQYQLNEFDDSNREDKQYKLGLGLLYIIDSGLFLEGRYAFGTKDSTQPGLSFDRNTYMVTLRKEF